MLPVWLSGSFSHLEDAARGVFDRAVFVGFGRPDETARRDLAERRPEPVVEQHEHVELEWVVGEEHTASEEPRDLPVGAGRRQVHVEGIRGVDGLDDGCRDSGRGEDAGQQHDAVERQGQLGGRRHRVVVDVDDVRRRRQRVLAGVRDGALAETQHDEDQRGGDVSRYAEHEAAVQRVEDGVLGRADAVRGRRDDHQREGGGDADQSDGHRHVEGPPARAHGAGSHRALVRERQLDGQRDDEPGRHQTSRPSHERRQSTAPLVAAVLQVGDRVVGQLLGEVVQRLAGQDDGVGDGQPEEEDAARHLTPRALQ